MVHNLIGIIMVGMSMSALLERGDWMPLVVSGLFIVWFLLFVRDNGKES